MSILVFLHFAVAKLHLFRNRPMYVHTIDAYRVIKEGRSAVILRGNVQEDGPSLCLTWVNRNVALQIYKYRSHFAQLVCFAI